MLRQGLVGADVIGAERAAALEAAGVLAVVSSWQEVADLVLPVIARRDDDLLASGAAR